jgi:hypothetical protein
MKQDYFYLMEKHHLGLLNEEERTRFTYLLEHDKEFNKEFHEFELTMRVINAEGKKHLKQKLSALNNKKPNRKNMIFYLFTFLILTGLVTIIIYLIFSKHFTTDINTVKSKHVVVSDQKIKEEKILSTSVESKKKNTQNSDRKILNPIQPVEFQNNDSLFAVHYKPFRHGSFEPVYRGENKLSNRDKFLSLYWQKKYAEALDYYQILTPTEKLNPNLKFQFAICLIENNMFNDAETVLEELNKEDKSRFGKEIKWYLSLLKLKRGVKINPDTFKQK